ncbi:MAG: TetR family transcriptional regulator [Pseudomonadota bacterium]
MVRRTKEDALATRESLLDAAEVLFQAQGVSRTSLNDIARQAGTTRGAIYWHFKDKADLFNAMMDRAKLPLEEAFDARDKNPSGAALDNIRYGMTTCLARIASDDRMRRVFEVATHKVEYIDELQAVRARHLTVRNGFLGKMEADLARAATEQGVEMRVPPDVAAHGLHAVVDGMIQNWLLQPEAFNLPETIAPVIDVYLAGLGFRVTSA